MEKIVEELLSTSPNSIIELFILDLNPIGVSEVYYFHPGKNELYQNVTWQSQEYIAFPIQATGFDKTKAGEIPRPSVLVSNIGNFLGGLVYQNSDLLGAKVTRKRTFLKYLDAVNFSAGNPQADPTVEFADEVYYINRKMSENHLFLEFELAAKWDVHGVELPQRVIMQDVCPWVYRGTDCGYSGTNYYDEYDIATTVDKDRCAKKLNSCELRFGTNAVLPFGGFPGVGLRR